jgi:hypothetical protein
MGTETIALNSKTGQHITRPVLADSTLTCTKTTAPDVYTHAVSTSGTTISQQTLALGDGMLVPRGNLTIWVFRKLGGDDPFGVEMELKSI